MTKHPEEYADGKTQPHVQVALAMKKRGISTRPGDTIAYVICVGESTTVAQRAFHIDEVKKEGSELKIGRMVSMCQDKEIGPRELTLGTGRLYMVYEPTDSSTCLSSM